MVLGAEGYGIFWMFVEMLYEGNGSIEKNYDLLAFQMRTSSETIKELCENFSLFYFKNDRICSKSVDRRLMARHERSNKAHKSAMRRWDGNANAMPTQCDSNAIKERKGKEKKEKSIFTPPTPELVREYCGERRNQIDPDQFVNFYTARGWMVGKNKMKDWKASIRYWETNGYSNTPPAKPNYIHPDWLNEEKKLKEKDFSDSKVTPEQMREGLDRLNAAIVKGLSK